MILKLFKLFIIPIILTASFLLLNESILAEEKADTKTAASDKEAITPETLAATFLINAEKGHSTSMLNLGLLYEQGIGVIKNLTTAKEWYEKAALAGEIEGYFRLGICYETGIGTKSDFPEAIKNYEKALNLGSANATHKMATLYLMGRGVAKDETKGLALLTKAAESGSGEAANELAVVYLNGLANLKKDPAQALNWFHKSAEAGHLEGVKNLAVAIKDGIGQKADPAEALQWFLVAKKGGLQAQDLDSVIDNLKKGLTADQIKNSEKKADDWLAKYIERIKKTQEQTK